MATGGGGVGIGKSIHAGAQVVADGTDNGALRLSRVLTNDPGTGVMRHADAGYDIAVETANERGVDLRTAALMRGIERVREAKRRRGVFP